MAIDIEGLLAEVSPESPCGEDLSYDPEYLELERIAQGTPEQQVGDTIVSAEEPNWREVRDQSVALLGKTKDLRVAFCLLKALIRTDGIAGLRDGLAVLRGIIERYWKDLHPQLDPDDDLDPMERINILVAFSPPLGFQETPELFRLVQTATLCESPVFHRSYALRDILIARGDVQPSAAEQGQSLPEMTEIEGAFRGERLNDSQRATLNESLQVVIPAAAEAAEHINIIDSLLGQYLGVSKSPDMREICGMVAQIATFVCELTGQGVPAGEAAGEAAPGGGAGPAGGGEPIAGEIRSPEDVIRVLDKICSYYARCEPSSPVPLLVNRAKRLVRKNFVEIIQDLTPESLRQIEVISGPTAEPDQPQQY